MNFLYPPQQRQQFGSAANAGPDGGTGSGAARPGMRGRMYQLLSRFSFPNTRGAQAPSDLETGGRGNMGGIVNIGAVNRTVSPNKRVAFDTSKEVNAEAPEGKGGAAGAAGVLTQAFQENQQQWQRLQQWQQEQREMLELQAQLQQQQQQQQFGYYGTYNLPQSSSLDQISEQPRDWDVSRSGAGYSTASEGLVGQIYEGDKAAVSEAGLETIPSEVSPASPVSSLASAGIRLKQPTKQDAWAVDRAGDDANSNAGDITRELQNSPKYNNLDLGKVAETDTTLSSSAGTATVAPADTSRTSRETNSQVV
jgi:hypothetical protein